MKTGPNPTFWLAFAAASAAATANSQPNPTDEQICSRFVEVHSDLDLPL